MVKIRRFHIKQRICEGKVSIVGDEARHVMVFRLKPGDQVELFDGQGNIGLGTIEKVEKTSILVHIGKVQKVRKSPNLRVLATAVPKLKRFDLLVQKATELGVDKIIPIITKRAVVKPRETKIERIKKIAAEAAKQSGRADVPEITSAITVNKLMQDSDGFDLKIIAMPNGKKIKEVLRGATPKKIICLIGPEGGFTDEELGMAVDKGFIPVNLGERILRVETAGISVLSALNYEYN
jgi:16S rRNA (uracil1498-N3)-methyltransferase